MAAFHWRRKIRFKDCDPAGIVFYPRYFEMINDCIEAFFDDALGWSFGAMKDEGYGIPMGQISARFESPSRLDDVVDWSLTIARLGGASADLRLVAKGAGRIRLRAEGTLVCVDHATVRSRRWPDPIRAKLGAYLEENAA